MRNLKCISRTRHEFGSVLPITAYTWNTVDDTIIFTFGPSKSNAIVELRSALASGVNNESTLLASWDAACPRPDLECDEVVNIHHHVASDSVCLTLAGGDIVVVRLAPLPGQEKIEIVGSVDAGIAAASWSPDEELLAIVTCADTLLYMTAEIDNVANVTFLAEDAKLSKQVSVGWGKQETQFQGKRARALQDPTLPEHVDQGQLSPRDGGAITISWRGDGAFVAVNTVQPQGRRMIRVLTREGVLDSVSEAVDGLESSLAWKPSGQHIASVQYRNESAQVVFFERNGLRHGEFSLRLGADDLTTWAAKMSLGWSADSAILAVGFLDRIQLWSMDNYHYHLKQEAFSESGGNASSAVNFRWHPEDSLRFLFDDGPLFPDSQSGPNGYSAVSKEKQLRSSVLTSITFARALTATPVVPPHDLGTLLLIDGHKLRITPLRVANVPPPSALYEVDLPSIAIDAAVSHDNSKMAVLHHHSISFYDLTLKDATSTPLSQSRLPLPSSATLQASQICFEDQDVIVLLKDLAKKRYCIYQTSSAQIYYPFAHTVEAILLVPSCQNDCLHTVTDQVCGRLASVDDEMASFEFQPLFKFPAKVHESISYSAGSRSIVFGLAGNGSLFANEHLLLRNCTSFLVTTAHLVLTTTNHLLKFIHLNDSAENMSLPLDEPDVDERCRNIERGAKLVAIMPSICAVTLQMPRGNLETIYPRALVVAGIRASIDNKRYKQAFLACRKHRVDLNILHDYDPQGFLESVPLIVRQLAKAEYVDLLLSQLSENDVTVTLYRNTLQSSVPTNRAEVEHGSSQGAHQIPTDILSTDTSNAKVNRICNAFLQVLLKNPEQHLQSIITANVCKNPPDIETGLNYIASLGYPESEQFETAVEHICFLADVMKIYETALGMYKLDLALAIAQQSQQDPREYLPYLHNLQGLDESERKFNIDNDLKRHANALWHLHRYASLEKVLAYVEKHELYREALEMNKHDEARHTHFLRSYADFLQSQNRFADAALAYESMSLHKEASASYSSARMWREALSSASLAGSQFDSMSSLAQSLADDLMESKSYLSAATILADHLQKIPEAARALCKGYHFSDAIRLLALRGQAELINTIVDTEAAEAFSHLTEFISDCRSQLTAQVPRIKELREKKQNDPLAFLEGTAEGEGGDVPDNISLAPSETSTAGGTLLTRYTGRNTGTVATGASRRTSKNRRREERKRARGKKGSVYEEEYLVNSIGRLLERVNETHQDVQQTVEVLCRRAMWERGRSLQGAFRDLAQGCGQVVPEVWKAPLVAKRAEVDNEAGLSGRPLGADGVLWDSLEETRKRRSPPVVKSFSGSALLNR